MVLTGFCPWKAHLLELEEEMGIAGELKYVLYAEGDPAGKWRIQVCRCSLYSLLGVGVGCQRLRFVKVS